MVFCRYGVLGLEHCIALYCIGISSVAEWSLVPNVHFQQCESVSADNYIGKYAEQTVLLTRLLVPDGGKLYATCMLHCPPGSFAGRCASTHSLASALRLTSGSFPLTKHPTNFLLPLALLVHLNTLLQWQRSSAPWPVALALSPSLCNSWRAHRNSRGSTTRAGMRPKQSHSFASIWKQCL